MFFRCKTEKAIQAAAVLLRLAADRRMSYLRLLKLLYIADRESLKRSLRPIIGSRPVAMKEGPLHSEVLDLVKGRHVDEPLWSEYIRRDRYEIELVKDRPGHDVKYAIDWSKIKNELGWQPTMSFEQGLAWTIDWYRKNEAWWKPLRAREKEYYVRQYGISN